MRDLSSHPLKRLTYSRRKICRDLSTPLTFTQIVSMSVRELKERVSKPEHSPERLYVAIAADNINELFVVSYVNGRRVMVPLNKCTCFVYSAVNEMIASGELVFSGADFTDYCYDESGYLIGARASFNKLNYEPDEAERDSTASRHFKLGCVFWPKQLKQYMGG